MNKELFLDSVDLSSYSSSPGWMGFYEIKSRSACSDDRIIEQFFSLLSVDSSRIEIISSLYFDSNIQEIASFYELDYFKLKEKVNRLHKRGVLRLADLSWKNEDYESEEYENYLDELRKDFRFIRKPPPEVIKDFLLSCMSLRGIGGHCFIFHSDLSLLSYAHEDRGFGFIFLKSATADKKDLLRSLIERLGSEFIWHPSVQGAGSIGGRGL